MMIEGAIKKILSLLSPSFEFADGMLIPLDLTSIFPKVLWLGPQVIIDSHFNQRSLFVLITVLTVLIIRNTVVIRF
jgi:hypothetical protein